MNADLRDRIEQGDLHFLDGLVLLGTIASQRWFGGKSRDVLDARVLDAGVVPGDSPLLAFAIVEVRYGLQSHDLYHLPLGFRPEADNWKTSIIAATDGWTVYDALADPDLVRGIVDLVADDRTLDIGEATLLFRSTGDLRDSLGESSEVRPMGAEQSNSSLVIDERLALKLYRRIEAGMNPELEILRFLTERGFEHIASLEGYISYEGRPLEATLAILQQFIPANGDGWELALDTIGSDPGWLPAHTRRLGEVTAELHNALASDPVDPHFAPEEPSTEALALISASIDEEIEQVFAALPDIPAVAPRPGPRRGGSRPAAFAHPHRLRRPGDPPPRRLPPGPGALDERRGLADPRLRGRARPFGAGAASQALAAARRRRDAALLCLRRVGFGHPAGYGTTRGLGGGVPARSSSRATSPRSTRHCCHPTASRSNAC